jgi:glutathione peroxidase
MNISSVYVPAVDGSLLPMSNFLGSPLLIINVASQCTYTVQYESMRLLDLLYGPRGLRILAFPCNDFGAQEPKSVDEVMLFLSSTFRINIPLFSKINCVPPNIHPLFKMLTNDSMPIAWNFEKFLIDRHGSLVKRFPSDISLSSIEIQQIIEKLVDPIA